MTAITPAPKIPDEPIFGDGLVATPISGIVSDNFANNNALGGYLFDDPILGLVTGNFATANGFSSHTSANMATANGFSLDSPTSIMATGTFTNNTAKATSQSQPAMHSEQRLDE